MLEILQAPETGCTTSGLGVYSSLDSGTPIFSSESLTFRASNLLDGDENTPWRCEVTSQYCEPSESYLGIDRNDDSHDKSGNRR